MAFEDEVTPQYVGQRSPLSKWPRPQEAGGAKQMFSSITGMSNFVNTLIIQLKMNN